MEVFDTRPLIQKEAKIAGPVSVFGVERCGPAKASRVTREVEFRI